MAFVFINSRTFFVIDYCTFIFSRCSTLIVVFCCTSCLVGKCTLLCVNSITYSICLKARKKRITFTFNMKRLKVYDFKLGHEKSATFPPYFWYNLTEQPEICQKRWKSCAFLANLVEKHKLYSPIKGLLPLHLNYEGQCCNCGVWICPWYYFVLLVG